MSSSVVTEPSAAPARPEAPKREPRSRISRLLARPEIGALAAAIVIFIFFYAIAPPFRTLPGLATVLYASSTIGIVAVGVALLMIGGEFDLSSRVAGTTPGLAAAVMSYPFSLKMWGGAISRLGIAPGLGGGKR